MTSLAAHVAQTFEVDGLPQYGEPSRKVFRHLDAIEGLVMEVYDLSALKAFEMLMIFQIGVEPFGVARAFDDERHTDIAQGQQGPVDRVERDAGEHLAYLPKDRLRRGVVRGFQKRLVDRGTLGSDFQTRLATPGSEGLHILRDPVSYCRVPLSSHGYPLTHPAVGFPPHVRDHHNPMRRTPQVFSATPGTVYGCSPQRGRPARAVRLTRCGTTSIGTGVAGGDAGRGSRCKPVGQIPPGPPDGQVCRSWL